MRTPAILLLLLPVLLAGCLGDGLGCGPAGRANWVEPGLYDAVEPGTVQGVDVHQEAPSQGLPFAYEGVPSSWNASLVRVGWDVGSVRGDTSLSVAEDPGNGTPAAVLSTVARNGTSQEVVRERLEAFLERTTDADADQRAAWTRAALANRSLQWTRVDPATGGTRDAYAYTARIPASATRLGALAGEVNATVDELPGGPRVASVELTSGNWTFRLELPTRSLELPMDEGEATLRVDARDRVLVSTDEEAYRERAEMKRWLNGTFQGLGLPQPTYEGWHQGDVVC